MSNLLIILADRSLNVRSIPILVHVYVVCVEGTIKVFVLDLIRKWWFIMEMIVSLNCFL